MKKGISIEYANEESPLSSNKWRSISELERITMLNLALKSFGEKNIIKVTKANLDGQVTIIFNEIMTASERGEYLLDLEDFFKNKVDEGITIWHEAIGDKNSLRNLRGIEVVPNEGVL